MLSHAEVAVFVTRGEGAGILLIHRSPEDGAYWHVVAGAVERNESDDEAAVRELLEEVGLAAQVGKAWRVVEWMYADDLEPVADPVSTGRQVVGIPVSCYHVVAPGEWEPTLNAEHDSWRWCDLDEAVALLRWPQTARALRDLLQPT